MASISFVKRPRYVIWLGILGFACVYAALIALLAMHSEHAHTAVAPRTASRSASYILPHPNPFVSLTEREQLRAAARWFGIGDDDETAFMADNFAATVPDTPRLDTMGEMRAVAVSPSGEIRSMGTVSVPRGRAYRYVLTGPGAEHIFIELGAHDGVREFGFASDRE